MKKIALATILAAASIAASAQVTVYGNLRGFVDSTEVGTVSHTSMMSDSSRVGVTASEKLSGGLTVRATVETAIAVTNPAVGTDTKIGDRQSTVGFISKMGSIDLGRAFNSHFLAVTNNDAFGTYYGSIAGDVHNLRTLRSGDAAFGTLNAGPAQISADRTFTAVGAETTTYSVSGKVGPVNATVAVFESGTAKSTVVAGQAKVRNLHVYASHSSDKDGAKESTGNLIGATMAVGNSPVTLKASYGTKSVGDVKAYNFGADYALSKRTAISVAYRNVNAATDTKQMGLGITTTF
jgi:predicted porin